MSELTKVFACVCSVLVFCLVEIHIYKILVL